MDLYKIIRAKGLRIDYVAERLFPNNKHPYNALLRVMNKGELSESQILTLCELVGATPNQLLGAGEGWTGRAANGLILRKGRFAVLYSSKTGVYSIEDEETDKTLGTYTLKEGTTVPEFLELLDAQLKELS